MSTSHTQVRVALIGLSPDGHDIPEHIKPRIVKGLEDTETQMAEAGFPYEFHPVSPEEGAAALGPKLQSQRPDVVVIGNGVRGANDLTPFFEQVIDVVRTSAPQAKLAFNTMPDNTLDAVKRWFPTVAK